MSNRKRERMEQTSHKVIEKRRRDRINNCLFELSQTVPAAFSKQTSGKLEKAEILEMTVDYLRAVQTTEIGMRFDNGEWFSTDIWTDFAQHYHTGYNECVREVLKYMTDVEGIAISDTRCARLLSFLHNRFRADAASAAGHIPAGGSGVLSATGSAGSGERGLAASGGREGGGPLVALTRNGFLGGGGGSAAAMIAAPTPSSRETPLLGSAAKTSSSRAVGGSSSLDTRLFAFTPYVPQAAPATSATTSPTVADNGSRAPLHPSPTSSAFTTAALNVVPSTPFRSLPPLTVPPMDFRFPGAFSAAREASAFMAASAGMGSGKLVFSKESATVELQSGLGLSVAPAVVRKDACPSM